MDRKLLVLLLVLLIAPISFAQSSFPFTVVRDANGKLSRIELPNKSALSPEDEDLLAMLREAADAREGSMGLQDDLSGAGLKEEEEKAAFEEAKRFLAMGVSKKDLNDPRLDIEFAKAKAKLNGLKVYRLLANPYQASAFDEENLTKEVVQGILEAAKLVFDFTPPLQIFEFLVDQHLDALETRREFHQNRLLVLLETQPSLFNAEEKSLIRSSIFYSRIWIVDLPKRDSARKVWKTYGDTKFKESMGKCSGFVSKNDRAYGPCFKVIGDEIHNRLVKKNLISKSTSLAYDFGSPYRVRNSRIGWMMLKLALKFVPAPGWAKTGVSRWISSNYFDQRRSDGYVYEFARVKGQNDLAAWIAISNANPLLGL